LQLATGQYIALIDADDIWKRDRLERGLDCLADRPEVGLVHGEVEVIDRNGTVSAKETKQFHRMYQRYRVSGASYERILDDYLLFSSTVLFRRHCLDRVGVYDPCFPTREDYDWYLRFAFHYPIYLMEGPPAAQYRIHEGNIWTQDEARKMASVYIRIYEKQLAELTPKIDEKESSQIRSRILTKSAEFHRTLRNRKQGRAQLIEALRLDPKIVFHKQWLKRLILS